MRRTCCLSLSQLTRPAEAQAGIETERLTLRNFRIEDFDDYCAMTSDPETFLYSERGPMTSDETWTRLLRHFGHWALLNFGLFAIEEKASGRFVGEAGFGDFRRKLGIGFDGVPEASWSIAPWARGQGFATEAARGALKWLEQERHSRSSVCLIHEDNAASLSVARKLGYFAYARLTYRGYPALIHRRPASAAYRIDKRRSGFSSSFFKS
jgi:RimJ/RimL family protein N-acetyltransferase